MSQIKLILVIVALLLAIPVATCWSQENDQADASAQTETEETDRSSQDEQPMMESSMKMDKMADAMTSMAEMCRTMMQGEMKMMPWKIGAGVIVGSILTLALALFVVLEIQWIRYWGLRIKSEKASQKPASGLRP